MYTSYKSSGAGTRPFLPAIRRQENIRPTPHGTPVPCVPALQPILTDHHGHQSGRPRYLSERPVGRRILDTDASLMLHVKLLSIALPHLQAKLKRRMNRGVWVTLGSSESSRSSARRTV